MNSPCKRSVRAAPVCSLLNLCLLLGVGLWQAGWAGLPTAAAQDDRSAQKEQRRGQSMRLEAAIEKVRAHIDLARPIWELKAFESDNGRFTVVHDTHPQFGRHCIWGEHLALLDAANNILWARRVKYHWPVVVGDEGTVAFAERTEAEGVVVIRSGPVLQDHLDLRLYDKTGRELASCPIGRLLRTNRLLQEWTLEVKSLFAGAFGPGDERFYFVTNASGHVRPELYCLDRTGELLCRRETSGVAGSHVRLSSNGHSLTIFGPTGEDGKRPVVRFDTRNFEMVWGPERVDAELLKGRLGPDD
jgi:hypothetical protein